MLFYHLKIAIRNIIKNKNTYLLNIIGLILALTVCFITLIYALFDYHYYSFRFNSDNVYVVQDQDDFWDFPIEKIPVDLSNYLENDVPGIKEVVRYEEHGDFQIQISPDDIFKERQFHFVDSNYFKYRNIQLLNGRMELLSPNDLLITKLLALKYFGTLSCTGKEIIVQGRNAAKFYFNVVGVFDYKASSELWPEYNLVAGLDVFHHLNNNFNLKDSEQNIEVYLILEDNTNPEDIKAHIEDFYVKHRKEDYLKYHSLSLKSLNEFPGSRVKIAGLISFLILLIALFNFIIHSNARFWERSKSIGIKKIAGAWSKQIVFHSLSESFIISLICVIIAFGLSVYLLPQIKDYIDRRIYIEEISIGIILLTGFILIVVVSALTSLSTLLLAGRYQAIHLVNKLVITGERGKFINSILISSQIAVFSFLLTMLFMTSKQMNYIQNKDWGFDSEQLLSVSLMRDPPKPARYYDFKSKLQQIPSILNYSGCRHVPPSYSQFIYGFINENREKIIIEYNDVDYSYIKTLGIKLKSGRDFDELLDKPAHKKIIVNQEFLDIKEIKNPYDTLVKVDDRMGLQPIIGVLDDYHMRGMDSKIRPLIMHLRPDNSRNMLIKISPDNVLNTLNKIKASFREVYPELAYQMKFVEDDIENLYQDKVRTNMLLGYYTIIAIIIACMGLFGLTMNLVIKKIKEVGIRKVNGATVKELLILLNREFLIWASLAFLLACPVANHISSKWMDNFAYKTEIDWWLYIIMGLAVFTIVLITISFQTIRVARRNPVEALRYE